jgi:hypothetical protein
MISLLACFNTGAIYASSSPQGEACHHGIDGDRGKVASMSDPAKKAEAAGHVKAAYGDEMARVDGQNAVFGGTSAVAPLWAGLVARINAAKGTQVGFINPQLYKKSAALNDITQGNNGDFSASTGWDVTCSPETQPI